jgi:hypothetical protein
LRVLGRGKVQRQAVEELEALSENSPFLTNIIQLVHDLIAVLSARQEKEHDIDKDDQELIMKLSEMYQQQLAEIKKQEREEGVLRERRAMIESILQVRFGELDSELATIIDQVIAMTREEFTPLLLQLSREELLARFTN